MQNISNEDELIERVVQNQYWSGFSKVNQISTRKISPDIDFLRIDDVHGETVGYEFKLLRFRKNWGRIDLKPMYTGIGQALHYFQFGIGTSYLVLGLRSEIPSKAFKEAYHKIMELKSTFDVLRITKQVQCIGLCVWIDKLENFDPALTPTENIWMSEDTKHLKECLLRKEFKYDRKFEFGEASRKKGKRSQNSSDQKN